jgi:hypothetical protein
MFYDGTSPPITYETLKLFERSLIDEVPRVTSLDIDSKEVDSRLKKILLSYDLESTKDI